MATETGTPSDQVNVAHDSLADYFSKLRKFVGDPLGSVEPPDFRDFTDVLDFSELHRMTSIRFSDAASFENGAAIENVHMMVSIMREFALRSKGKTDYYADAETDYLTESNYYSAMKVFWVNMINGNYVEGKTS